MISCGRGFDARGYREPGRPSRRSRVGDRRLPLQSRRHRRRGAPLRRRHIPGAVYAHLDRDLSAPKTGTNGRHPLPSVEAMAAMLGRLGIEGSTQVVAYDQDTSMCAVRLWWMLRYLGHDAVAVLDGGMGSGCARGGRRLAASRRGVPRVSPRSRARRCSRSQTKCWRVSGTEDADRRRTRARALPWRGRAPGPRGRTRARRGEPLLHGEPRARRHVPARG